MNIRLVLRVTGRVMQLESAVMLIPLAVALLYRESPAPFLYSILIILISGTLLSHLPARRHFFAREGFVAVGLIWILTGVLGGLPFYFSGYFNSFVDCVFESCSGFTTTGSTILTDIESLPKGILFWRSFTHWLGGMGVLVFLLAITRFTVGSGDSMHIMRAESPGPQVNKLVPQTFHSAQIVYIIYIGMTALQIILMLLGGVSPFEAVTLTFGTAGTGGFAVRNDGLGSYSPYIQWVVTIFMALFGVNFGIYYLLLQRSVKKALRNEELRMYLLIMVLFSLLIFVDILPLFPGYPGDALRHSCFQVASIMTTTGYATADFDLWPQLSRTLLVVLMIVGASAGSTGGGMKCSRVLLLLKSMNRQVRRMLHPNTVKHVSMDGEVVPPETIQNTFAFLSAYCLITITSVCLISLDNFSLETNLTAVLSCLNNIGPGLAAVGPMSNFSAYSDFSKLLLSLNMLLGRLEIFPIIIAFVPSVWKRARG